MFINKSKLCPRLQPESYLSESQHRAEVEHLFWPAWHPVATTRDVARPGDFVTFELLGQPVLLRNMGGELRAFLNVCPHRHCELTNEARGSSERLRCRYHGWEFNAEGRTGRIPDAQSFRPFDRENACLRSFRVATYGQLVFVSLAPEGPTLREFLGPHHDRWLESFDGPYRFAASWERDFACNWKVVAENALETYHVPFLHPWTGSEQTPAEKCEHVLDERYSTFTLEIKSGAARHARAINRLIHWLGGTVRGTYEHHCIHPHLTFTAIDINRMVLAVYPLTPTTCRYRMFAFPLRGDRGGIVAPLLARLIRTLAVAGARRVFEEDGSIYEAVQRGLKASPFPGVIGTREERVYVLQDYVDRQCRAASQEAAQTQPVPGA